MAGGSPNPRGGTGLGARPCTPAGLYVLPVMVPEDANDYHSGSMTGAELTLTDLKAGQRVRIASVDPSDPGVRRLMTLGLVEGAELTFLRSSLGGDPLEFRVHGTSISLRKAQARRFRVERLNGNER